MIFLNGILVFIWLLFDLMVNSFPKELVTD